MRIKVWEQLWMNERQNMKMAEIKIERIDEWQLIGSVFSRWDKNGRSNLCSYLQETLLKTMGRKVNPLKYFAEYKCYTNITCFVEIHSLICFVFSHEILLFFYELFAPISLSLLKLIPPIRSKSSRICLELTDLKKKMVCYHCSINSRTIFSNSGLLLTSF